ncbi:MAG: hypothetical protein WBG13_21560, partial [Pseudolabrys sp.]
MFEPRGGGNEAARLHYAYWRGGGLAQQAGNLRRVGILMSASESDKGYQSLLATFRDELGRLGWVENRNIHLDYRWGAVDEKSRHQSAKELITIQPD